MSGSSVGSVLIYAHRYCYAAGEAPLVAEVEEHYLSSFRDREVTSFDGDGNFLWYELDRALSRILPKKTANIIVIRRAESVPADIWENLTQWVHRFGGHHPLTVVLALSSQPWVTTADIKRMNKEKKEVLQEDVRARVFLSPRVGCYVECNPLRFDAQVMYAHRKLNGRLGIVRSSKSKALRSDLSPASVLVHRCGNDLSRLRSELTKLGVVTKGVISKEMVEALVHQSPGEEFVDALVSGNKSKAAAIAPLVTNFPLVLSILDSRCQYLFLIREGRRVLGRNRRSVDEISRYLNLDRYLVGILLPHCQSFSLDTTTRRYTALMRANQSLRSGAPASSVFTVLVSEW